MKADDDERHVVDDDHDDNNSGDTQFSNRVVRTKLGGGTKQPLAFRNNKVPRTPRISASMIEAIEALMSSDRETEDESGTISAIASIKQKRLKDKRKETTLSEHEGTRNAGECAGPKRQRETGLEDEDPISVKAQKLTEHEGRPRAKDYDDMTQEFVTAAVAEYRARLCAQSPMPDHSQESSLLAASWAKACQVTGVKLTRSPDISKLITSRGSQVRGELKTKLRPLVEVMFGFHSSQSKSAIKKNRSLAEALKEGTNFAFKHMAPMEEDRRGFLKAPLIQKIINTMWFANKHDEGVMFPEHFKPFPYPTLALVLTAIECCIDEWATGKRGDIPFTTQEYRPVYEAYLKCLQDFDYATKDVGVLWAICTRIYEAGRVHSGAGALTTESQCKVSARVVAAAIQEHHDGSTTEDESD
ncbi:hypothetical protein EDD15DRAFT_2372133 [Pisolithus albus]|nr:hypothetical protein EDD15DRAFT_2372133 [Pisolithus albus]